MIPLAKTDARDRILSADKAVAVVLFYHLSFSYFI